MAKINLRDYYPFYHADFFIDVSDEVEAVFLEAKRLEQNYIRRRFYNKAYYSLDAGDGIENEILFLPLSPDKVYERKITTEQLHAAIASLPITQAKRVYAHYILGISKANLAAAEGVDEKNIRQSISRALRSIEIFLKKNC